MVPGIKQCCLSVLLKQDGSKVLSNTGRFDRGISCAADRFKVQSGTGWVLHELCKKVHDASTVSGAEFVDRGKEGPGDVHWRHE